MPTQSVPAATIADLPSDSSGVVAAFEGTLEQIYGQVNPSVVNISVVQKQEVTLPTFPDIQGFFDFPFSQNPQSPSQPQEYYSHALGSGFVWDADGHIVTNNHVVDGADKVTVTFSDGTSVSADIVGADPASDLAVIHVDVDSSQLHPVQVGDSTQVKVGQLAIAIGNPVRWAVPCRWKVTTWPESLAIPSLISFKPMPPSTQGIPVAFCWMPMGSSSG